MNKSELLFNQIKKSNHRLFRPRHNILRIANILHVLKEYWPLGQYMLKKFGWKSCYSFWYTKLFVADEGGEFALLNPLFRKFPRLLRSPFKLEMEHTTICDKKCLFCEHTHWKEKKTRVTYDQFKSVVDSMKNLKWMNITGEGSGFLNKDFLNILSYLRMRHINVNFVDELDFIDENIARKIIELGINSIYISFDAAAKTTYQKIKKGCDFDNTLKNIRTLLRLKEEMKSPFPVLHFRFIITTLNFTEIPEYVKLISTLKNRGVRAKVEFVGLLTFPEIEHYYLPVEEIPEDIFIKTYKNALENNINIHFSHEGKYLPAINSCGAWTEPYILIGGEVISCCAIVMSNNRKFLREHSFGNVYDIPFEDIWKSEKYKKFRALVNKKDGKVPKTCYGCRAYNTEDRFSKYGICDLSDTES